VNNTHLNVFVEDEQSFENTSKIKLQTCKRTGDFSSYFTVLQLVSYCNYLLFLEWKIYFLNGEREVSRCKDWRVWVGTRETGGAACPAFIGVFFLPAKTSPNQVRHSPFNGLPNAGVATPVFWPTRVLARNLAGFKAPKRTLRRASFSRQGQGTHGDQRLGRDDPCQPDS
jgi:hypothetical protein